MPSLLQDTVYVGASAGSRRVTATFGEHYDGTNPLKGSDKGWDSSILRCARTWMPTASLAHLEKWAAGVDVPAYAIDGISASKPEKCTPRFGCADPNQM